MSAAHRRRVLALLGAAFFMTILDGTSLLTAPPSIENDLHLGGPAIQRTVTAYALAFSGPLLLFGRAVCAAPAVLRESRGPVRGRPFDVAAGAVTVTLALALALLVYASLAAALTLLTGHPERRLENRREFDYLGSDRA